MLRSLTDDPSVLDASTNRRPRGRNTTLPSALLNSGAPLDQVTLGALAWLDSSAATRVSSAGPALRPPHRRCCARPPRRGGVLPVAGSAVPAAAPGVTAQPGSAARAAKTWTGRQHGHWPTAGRARPTALPAAARWNGSWTLSGQPAPGPALACCGGAGKIGEEARRRIGPAARQAGSARPGQLVAWAWALGRQVISLFSTTSSSASMTSTKAARMMMPANTPTALKLPSACAIR